MRTQREIRQRAPLWLAVLLFANLILMTIDARDTESKQRVIRTWAQAVAAPFQSATSGVGHAGVGFFGRFGSMWHAEQEAEELRGKLGQLENELAQTRVAQSENERLRSLLNLRDQSSYETIPATVTGRDPSAWFDTLTINRGSSSGVELQMPVSADGGVVGRVVAVSLWSSQVMLVTHERAGAGAIVGQLGVSSAMGTIKGLGRDGLLEMRYVSGLEKVEAGDHVMTTGQDRIFPAGLEIGKVLEVKPGTATSAHTIFVRPSARLESLRYVTVLKYRHAAASQSNQNVPASTAANP